MKMKFFLMLAAVLVFAALMPTYSQAEEIGLIAAGECVPVECEKKDVVEQRAVYDAETKIIEMAEVAVDEYAKLKNINMSEDEKLAIAWGISEFPVKRVQYQGGINGETLAEVGIIIDKEKIAEVYSNFIKNRANYEQIKNLHRDYASNDSLMKQLRYDYKTAEKNKPLIAKEIAENEKRFMALRKVDDAVDQFIMKKDFARALLDFNAAIVLDPTYAVAYNSRGGLYYEMGKMKEALEDFRKALLLDGAFVEAYSNIGNIKAAEENHEEAVVWFKKALALRPDFAEALNNMGSTYAHMGDYVNALKCFAEALKVDPDYDYAYNNSGLVYYSQKDYKKAIECFSQAVKLDPAYDFAYFNRAMSYLSLNDTESAKGDLLTAEKLMPKNAGVHLQLGYIYYGEGNFDLALQQFRLAVYYDVKAADGYWWQAEILKKRGQTEDAADVYKLFVKYAKEGDTRLKNSAK